MRSLVVLVVAVCVGHVFGQEPICTDPSSMKYMARDQELRRIALWTGQQPGGLIYMQGLDTERRPRCDTEKPFRQDSTFLWLTNFELPGFAEAVFVLNTTIGGTGDNLVTYLFVPEPGPTYGVWNGVPYTRESVKARYQVDVVNWSHDFGAVVRPLKNAIESALGGARSTLFTLPGLSLADTSDPLLLGEMTLNQNQLWPRVQFARAHKTDQELELLQAATNVTCNAHRAVMVRAGRSPEATNFQYEFQVAGQFERENYVCDVAIDQPVSRVRNDLVLLDAGAEILGYGADITRTWPANGRFTIQQKAIYDIVYWAQEVSMEQYTPGVAWTNAGAAARLTIVQGLKALNFFPQSVSDQFLAFRLGGLSIVCRVPTLMRTQELLNNNMDRIFYPHGLGHFVGLDVHDPPSAPSSLQPSQPFRARMVLSNEPGIYFIRSQLDTALRNPQQARYLNAAVIEPYMTMGGVRIEDQVEITETGHVIQSGGLARSSDDVEALMAGKFVGPTPQKRPAWIKPVDLNSFNHVDNLPLL